MAGESAEPFVVAYRINVETYPIVAFEELLDICASHTLYVGGGQLL